MPRIVDDENMAGTSVFETHISTLFFTADRVFKLLKPVCNSFLDHRSISVRVEAAQRELDLNRRIAPDVYLGLADVVEHDELVDRMIVMRRLSAELSLTSFIERGELTRDLLRSVARSVAVFHAGLEPIHDPNGPGSASVQRKNWEDSFAELDRFVGQILDPTTNDRIVALATAYLDGHPQLFDERIVDGHIVDGHGDLLADDIFCLDDGPRILDCLAFRDDLRIGDVLSDIGFLAMDLHRLAGPKAASELIAAYDEFTGEQHPGSLAHHYVAYRAHVRCKVAALRWEQGAPEFGAVARMYHRLTLDQLERSRTRLVLVGGGPGAGKTTIASRVAEHYGWPVLSSDPVRKDLEGVERLSRAVAKPDEGIYTAAASDATYAELLRQTELLLDAGQSVVIDASWSKERYRVAARKLAASHIVELVEIDCTIDPTIARERVARRLADGWSPSDATPEIVDHMKNSSDRWNEATSLDTSQPVGQNVRQAIEIVAGSACNDEQSTQWPRSDFWGAFIASSGRFATAQRSQSSHRRK